VIPALPSTTKERVVVVEHIDPDQVGSGGIDGMILDYLRVVRQTVPTSLLGVTASGSDDVGQWQRRDVGGSQVDFLPICALDKRKARRVPHSVRFAVALFVHRRRLPRGRYLVPRVETATVLRLLRLQYSLFLHNDLAGLTGKDSDSFWKRTPWLYAWMERVAVLGAASVGVFSAAGAERLTKYRDDVVRLRSWFNPEVFFPSSKDSPTAPVIVLWVGRFESQKDPLLALSAFAEFSETTPTRLVMVGSGSLLQRARDHCRQLGIDDDVTFAGAVPKSDVARFMRSADVLLLTSHYEGSPTVLVEAAASGIPSAATSEADTDHFLTHAGCGSVSRSRDPRAIAEAMSAALEKRLPPTELSERVADRSLEVALLSFHRVMTSGQRSTA
jgi:glycosyltransferase involved in cell wall biosynthesis